MDSRGLPFQRVSFHFTSNFFSLRSLLTLCLIPLVLSDASGRSANLWKHVKEKHSWPNVPKGWVLHGPAPPGHTLDLHIALKGGNPDALVSNLLEVSNPTNKRYGTYLTKEEVDSLVAPHPDSVDLVKSWLEHHKVDLSGLSCHRSGKWMVVRLQVAVAERLLQTKYQVYRHTDSNSSIVRTMSYSLPRTLHDHVSMVAPTTYFGHLRPMRAISTRASLAPTTCNATITPNCLRNLYQSADYVPKATSTNRLAVTGYLNESASERDLNLFLQNFRPEAAGATFEVVNVNGGQNNQSHPGTEANLDVQYAEAMSWPTPNIFYSTGGSPPFIPDLLTPNNTNEPYLDWLNFVLNISSPLPQTISTSYGDDEQTVPPEYAQEVCTRFAQLGARGSSVLFASGDFGGHICLSSKVPNQPIFPASCPFVTAVGATTGTSPERAAYFSGGGFSNYFAQPSYQNTAVSAYLSSIKNTFSGLFNASGRAFPDVSAQGDRFMITFNGQTILVSGTSASTPVFAGLIALLNDFRLANNKSPLGFLNPLLYQSGASGLVDITTGGHTDVASTSHNCNTDGFNATVGWDPITGLGTPNFQNLLVVIENLG